MPDLLAIYSKQLGDDLNQMVTLVHALLHVPIIAVAGLNDQGKSSLVASFLSPSGGARVLRGTKGTQGTFRFTLWLPAKWGRDHVLRGSLDVALSAIFGHAPESLHDDPPIAHAAQNNHSALGIPLIAWDERLDELELALLDCPDVQKQPIGAGQGAAEMRLQMLQNASKICAGIILVAKHVNLTTRPLDEVANSFPAGLRIYALNQARNLTPGEILIEARDALSLADDGLCYAAYDFDLVHYKDFTPKWDANIGKGRNDPKFPCFFRLTTSSDLDLPDHIDPERSLHCLARQIDKKALVGDFQYETLVRLKAATLQGIGAIKEQLRGQSERISQQCALVWEACNAALCGGEGERLILSAEMANSLSESIIDCAPGYLKWTLHTKAAAGRAGDWIGKSVVKLSPGVANRFGRSLAMGSHWIKENILKRPVPHNKSVSVPERLTSLLHARWLRSGVSIDKNEVERAVDGIVERFNQVGATNLPKADWDRIASEFWKMTPKGLAAFAVATSTLIALAVLLYATVDPLGGTVLISFALGKTLMALTTKELLTALGLGTAVNYASAGRLQKQLESKLGPLQRSRFFAVTCDELGLPREYPKDIVADSTLPMAVNRDGLCLRRFELFRDGLDVDAVNSLQKNLEEV